VIGDVRGRPALILDDEIDTAGTITESAAILQKFGATKVYAACTHPVFSGPAVERLAASPLEEVVITDTVPLSQAKADGLPKLKVISVAPLLGEAIRRIHTGQSVGELFG